MSVDIDQFTNEFIGVAEFSDRAIKALEQLHSSEVHFPRPRNVKSLIEEIWPMAIFARSLDIPQQRVSIKYSGNRSNEPDGRIRLSGSSVSFGWIDAFYDIETTVAEQENEYLHRELLATTGAAFHNPDTKRVGSRRQADSFISNEPKAVSSEAPLLETIEVVSKAIRRKVDKEYQNLPILVVNVNSGWNLTTSELCEVAEAVYTDELRSTFPGVYLVCPHSASRVPVVHLWKKDRVEEWARTEGFVNDQGSGE